MAFNNPAAPSFYLEHVNLTVQDIEGAISFLLAAMPSWRIRGSGAMEWFGKTIRWVHVGDAIQYVALQSGGVGPGPDWQAHTTGAKHIGIVVPALDEVVKRLEQAGFAVDHWGGKTAQRNSVYVLEGQDIQFEFVEYASSDLEARAEYA
jgi:hypothetical protein